MPNGDRCSSPPGRIPAFRRRMARTIARQRVDRFPAARPRQPVEHIVGRQARARQCPDCTRLTLTREVWEAVNTSWMTLGALLKRQVREDDLPDVLAAIRQQSAQVRGRILGHDAAQRRLSFRTPRHLPRTRRQHRAHPRRQLLSAAAVGRAYRQFDRQCAVGDDPALGVGAPRLSLALWRGDQRAQDRRIPDPL